MHCQFTSTLNIPPAFSLSEQSPDSTLASLDLGFCKLGFEGVTALGTMLATNSSLQELILSGCDVDDAGAAALACGLEANRSLVFLNLDSNSGIGDAGAQAFAVMLKVNASLQRLRLGATGIRDVGACALAEACAHNSTLTKLSFNLCEGITEGVGEAALIRAWQASPTLVLLTLGNRFSVDGFGASISKLVPAS